MNTHRKKISAALLGFALAGAGGMAHASGFALTEQSASGLGTAFAGMGAITGDPSGMYYNPATLSAMDGSGMTVGVHVIQPSAKLSDASATATTGNVPYATAGNNGGDGGVTGYVPNFYYARPLAGNVTFGFGINAPFGLATKYNKDWIGRYHAIDSEMYTLNLNPALSFKLSDRWAFGIGLNAQYIDAKLSQAADSYLTCAGLYNQNTSYCNPGALTAAPGYQPQDSYATIKGDSWGYGMNFGFLYRPSDRTTIGFGYRSTVIQNLSGTATFDRSAAFNNAMSASPLNSQFFVNQSVDAAITLPDSASLSWVQLLSPDWTLMTDLTWTGWSHFKELVVDYANFPYQPSTTTTEDWKDTWRVSAGATYRVNGQWKLRGGLAYDQTPIPNAEHRTPRIPGNDRTWIALGANWAWNRRSSLDVGYAHLFVPNTKINNTTETGANQTLTGTYKSSVDILSAQYNMKF
jgi:long-chain fatty acid transport protein